MGSAYQVESEMPQDFSNVLRITMWGLKQVAITALFIQATYAQSSINEKIEERSNKEDFKKSLSLAHTYKHERVTEITQRLELSGWAVTSYIRWEENSFWRNLFSESGRARSQHLYDSAVYAIYFELLAGVEEFDVLAYHKGIEDIELIDQSVELFKKELEGASLSKSKEELADKVVEATFRTYSFLEEGMEKQEEDNNILSGLNSRDSLIFVVASQVNKSLAESQNALKKTVDEKSAKLEEVIEKGYFYPPRIKGLNDEFIGDGMSRYAALIVRTPEQLREMEDIMIELDEARNDLYRSDVELQKVKRKIAFLEPKLTEEAFEGFAAEVKREINEGIAGEKPEEEIEEVLKSMTDQAAGE